MTPLIMAARTKLHVKIPDLNKTLAKASLSC
jgi:hypothetical protein